MDKVNKQQNLCSRELDDDDDDDDELMTEMYDSVAVVAVGLGNVNLHGQ